MKKQLVVLGGMMVSGTLFAAAPFITEQSTRMVQADDGLVTITYDLVEAPAIVTLDIQTNRTGAATENAADWISIGDDRHRAVTGDVNRLVEGTGTKTIFWNPCEEMAGVKLRQQSCRAQVKAWAEDAPPDYLVVDLRRDKDRDGSEPRVRYFASTNALPYEGECWRTSS